MSAFPTTTDPATIDLRDPGELLAATPHLLGFQPAESLVLIGHRGGGDRIGNVVRADLPALGDEAALARRLLEPLSHGSTAVTVVVIGERRCAGTELLPARATVTAVRDVFTAAGLLVPHALWTPRIRAGAPWRCYEDSCCSGRLPDPQTTVLAAVTAHAGMITHDSRAAMERQLEPVSSERLARLDALLRERAGAGAEENAAGVERGRRSVRAALARTWTEAPEFSDDELVEVLSALTLHPVRDGSLATALPVGSRRAMTAERLWLTLTRHAPPSYRAEPACLLAYSAYVRGEGALAGMALAVAREAAPQHVLQCLLTQALEHALPPETLARLGSSCEQGPIWEVPDTVRRSARPPSDAAG